MEHLIPNAQNPTIADSTDMYYDATKHRYMLTKAGVEKYLNIDLDALMGETNTPVFLEEISKDLYRYVYTWGRREERKRRVQEYLMAMNPDLHDIIRDAMLHYVRASRRGNWNLIKDLSPADFTSGIVMINVNHIPTIPQASIQEMMDSRILFRGNYSFILPEDLYRVDY